MVNPLMAASAAARAASTTSSAASAATAGTAGTTGSSSLKGAASAAKRTSAVRGIGKGKAFGKKGLLRRLKPKSKVGRFIVYIVALGVAIIFPGFVIGMMFPFGGPVMVWVFRIVIGLVSSVLSYIAIPIGGLGIILHIALMIIAWMILFYKILSLSFKR